MKSDTDTSSEDEEADGYVLALARGESRSEVLMALAGGIVRCGVGVSMDSCTTPPVPTSSGLGTSARSDGRNGSVFETDCDLEAGYAVSDWTPPEQR